MNIELSASDLAVYAFVEQHYSLQGYAPSTNEIMQECGFRSKDTANHHIWRLVLSGWLQMSPGKHRALVPIHYPRVYYRLKS